MKRLLFAAVRWLCDVKPPRYACGGSVRKTCPNCMTPNWCSGKRAS